MTVRSPLRDPTRADHDAVDRLFSRFDLSRTVGYRSFLAAQAAAFIPVERALEDAGAASVVDDWADRRRADRLRADLADLGGDVVRAVAPPALRTEAAILGVVYVLEGSRLGGAMLSRRLAPGSPARFLTAPARPGAWRALLRLLDRKLARPAECFAAAEAARACFRCFEDAALLELESLVA